MSMPGKIAPPKGDERWSRPAASTARELCQSLVGGRDYVAPHRVHALVLQLHLCCRYGLLLSECGRGGASMSVAVWSGSLVTWERELAALKARVGPVFGRAETP